MIFPALSSARFEFAVMPALSLALPSSYVINASAVSAIVIPRIDVSVPLFFCAVISLTLSYVSFKSVRIAPLSLSESSKSE